ncbi:MAG: hypothetical protein AB1486_20500 [Planctomycetota bacterium]
MSHLKPRILVFLLLGALSGTTVAQTDWAIESVFPSYGEFNSPPPPCLPPAVPYAVNFPPVPPAGCPSNAPFPIPCRMGGSAVDNNGNIFSGGPAVPAMVHSDGFTIEVTDEAGAYIVSMPVPPGAILPGLISGLAYDSVADICFITDGFFCAGVSLAACVIPPVVVPVFALPVTPGAGASGLGYDPCTGTIWFCECGTGLVKNCTLTGGLITTFPASPPLMPLLEGLDVNKTNGNVQVTDGVMVAEFTPAGALAPVGPFYLTANPYPVPVWAAPVSGLGFSLRPQRYGVGCPVPGPLIGYAGGYPWAGNAGFSVNETGAPPGAVALFVISLTRACPALPIGPCPGTGLWVMPPFLVPPINLGLVPGSGFKSIPIPLPAPGFGPCSLPVGIPLYMQFVNILGGSLFLSDALTFTIGAP